MGVRSLVWGWFLSCPGSVLPGWGLHAYLVISTYHTAYAWKMPIYFLQPAFRVHAVTSSFRVWLWSLFIPSWPPLSHPGPSWAVILISSPKMLPTHFTSWSLSWLELRILWKAPLFRDLTKLICPFPWHSSWPGLRNQPGLVGDELGRAPLMVDLPISKLESLPL